LPEKGGRAMATRVEISKLRPIKWYLDGRKLDAIRQVWQRGEESLLPPITIGKVENEIALIDGHCRAYVALENGANDIPAVWGSECETDYYYRLHRDFHRRCSQRGIAGVQDLKERIFEIADINNSRTMVFQE
jgi:hypothetical protein